MKILVSALEPSANLHLKPILDEIECEIFGIFDESLGRSYIKSSEFSVMGFVDVLKKIPRAKRAIEKMAKMSLEADKILLIDSPAFNIPLAKKIRQINPNANITYYILPKAWAWRRKRAKVVEELCDQVASIFPFEKSFYPNSTYVGNPLLDEIKKFKVSNEILDAVAFLPGSRKSEIKSLMNVFRETRAKLDQKAYLVIPPNFKNKIDEVYGDVSGFELSFDTHEALRNSDFAFICSGTASLESALIGTPFVVVYRAKKIDYFIAKKFIQLRHIGLANIIFDFEGLNEFAKELLQEDVNAKNLLYAFASSNSQEFLQKRDQLITILSHGSAANVAKILKK